MAMSGVGLAGISLAEAYAMRALHKEKMKKMEKQKAVNDVVGDENETPSGCFFWASKKKTHSSKVSSAVCEEKVQADAKL